MSHYSKTILLSVMALLITACNQNVPDVNEQDKPNTDSVPATDSTSVYANLFSENTYVWKLEQPYIQDDHYSAWLDIEKKIHTPFQYELLTHTMTIRGIDTKRLDWEEKIDREYTSAYRYIGNEEQPIFLLHKDDWELFDTVYRMTEERNVTMSYSIDYPSVSFQLNNIYMNATWGLFNYDYELFIWDSSCPLTGEFITTDTLQCNLSTLSNRKDTISIERTFINPN